MLAIGHLFLLPLLRVPNQNGSREVPLFEVELAREGGRILTALEERGFLLEVVDDYDRVPGLVEQVGRLKTLPMMDPGRLDFEVGEAVWLFLKREGRCVASVSAKIVNLHSETLGGYTRRTSRGQYGRSSDPISNLDPMFDLIRGRVVYTGQVQTELKENGKKNICIKELIEFIRFMQLVILSRWQFDWMFGFISEADLPLNRHYGFSTAIRHAITWGDPPPDGRENSHVLLASSRRQVELLFSSVTHKLSENQGSRTT